MNNRAAKHECNDDVTSEQLRKPFRSTRSALCKAESTTYETADRKKGNIYSLIDNNANCDDNISPPSVRKSPVTGRNSPLDEICTNTGERTHLTKHIQQERTGRAQNYEKVYTEVTLKEKESLTMPLRSFRNIVSEKKKVKTKFSGEVEEPIGVGHCEEPDGRPEPLQSRPTQKIISSPTRGGKGYENISLRDEVITTPLDEVEGRPYMNLGFHKSKGKMGSEKRRSADDAAIKLLLNLQNEKKIGDELTLRRKSNAESSVRKNSYDLDLDEYDEEVSYVNVGKDRKLFDSSGRSVTQSITGKENNGSRSRRPSEQSLTEEESAYENISLSANSRNDSSFTPPSNANATADELQTTIDSRRFNGDIQDDHLYSNVGFADGRGSSQQNRRRECPIPKPRPKRPERRKISNVQSSSARRISDGSVSAADASYNEDGFSHGHGYMANGKPNVLAQFGISESSYVNVGSSGYHDEFDVGVSNETPNFVNVNDEFQSRKARKKSGDSNLTYADVTLIRGRDQSSNAFHSDDGYYVEVASLGKEGGSPDFGKRSSPKEAARSRYAYTEIDFMKSQGISEAVRERRVESFEGNTTD